VSAKGEGDQKRGVAISLGKNSATFIRLPTDDWGLLEWYPNVREKKKRAGENGNGDKADAGEKASDTELEPSASAEPELPVEAVEPEGKEATTP
jgi:hypothetical protein